MILLFQDTGRASYWSCANNYWQKRSEFFKSSIVLFRANIRKILCSLSFPSRIRKYSHTAPNDALYHILKMLPFHLKQWKFRLNLLERAAKRNISRVIEQSVIQSINSAILHKNAWLRKVLLPLDSEFMLTELNLLSRISKLDTKKICQMFEGDFTENLAFRNRENALRTSKLTFLSQLKYPYGQSFFCKIPHLTLPL